MEGTMKTLKTTQDRTVVLHGPGADVVAAFVACDVPARRYESVEGLDNTPTLPRILVLRCANAGVVCMLCTQNRDMGTIYARISDDHESLVALTLNARLCRVRIEWRRRTFAEIAQRKTFRRTQSLTGIS